MWSEVELYISSYPKYIKVQRFKSRTTVLHIFFLCKPATFLLPRVKHGKPFFILSLRDIYNFIQKQITEFSQFQSLPIIISLHIHWLPPYCCPHCLLIAPLTASLLLPSLFSHCSKACLIAILLRALLLLTLLALPCTTACLPAAVLQLTGCFTYFVLIITFSLPSPLTDQLTALIAAHSRLNLLSQPLIL